MANKREFDDDDGARVKRVKVEQNGSGNGKIDAKSNPYLAHWNDEPKSEHLALRGHLRTVLTPATEDPANSADRLYSFKRHATTAKDAKSAEDGPLNPFTGKTLSKNYMSILKKRRDLPVHQQR